jgi:hypothetical protein
MVRRILLVFAAVLVLVVVAFGALVAVNAFDESLTPEATALLEPKTLPAPSEKNGYVDMLAIGAPADANTYAAGLKVLEAYRAQDQPGFKWTDEWKASVKPATPVVDKKLNACAPSAKTSCLEAVAANPELAKVVAAHEAVFVRYRAIREKPEYVELVAPRLFDAWMPMAPSSLHMLSLAAAAASVQAGDLEAAVKELEQENAFLRKAAAGAVNFGQKLVSVSYLGSNALFVAEVARRPDAQAYLPRLQALMQPLSAQEAGVETAMRNEGKTYAVQFGNLNFAAFASDLNGPWERWLARLFYRPRETANIWARRSALLSQAAQVPVAQYRATVENAKRESGAMLSLTFPGTLVNPVGKSLLELMGSTSGLEYVGRVHDTQALLALVSTQLALRAAGAATPDAIAAALSGPAGRARPDPYTGKPMLYDAKAGTLGFEPNANTTTAIRAMKKKQGRAAIAI